MEVAKETDYIMKNAKGGTIMNKIDKVTVVKALGMIMTIGGMIASNWTGKKEQDQALEKLVNEKLQKH